MLSLLSEGIMTERFYRQSVFNPLGDSFGSHTHLKVEINPPRTPRYLTWNSYKSERNKNLPHAQDSDNGALI